MLQKCGGGGNREGEKRCRVGEREELSLSPLKWMMLEESACAMHSLLLLKSHANQIR